MSLPVPTRVLVTGTAGFIGFHLARRLIDAGHVVCGIDGMTAYYDVGLKRRRHGLLRASNRFSAHEIMLEDEAATQAVFRDFRPEIVVHLAAQAGVRYSLENPRAYLDANLVGTFNLMEAVREAGPRHFLMASTSSVYGGNLDQPFRETARTAHPLTLYAATKGAAELMTHAYAHLHGLPTTMFRFFTVYGPWGRPDMALFKFVRAMLAGEPIEVYAGGAMQRDFTYIDDLVDGIVGLMAQAPRLGEPVAPEIDSLSPVAPHRIVNIGGGNPVGLDDFIATIEEALGIPAKKLMLPLQPGDVPSTVADTRLLVALTGARPATPVSEGVGAFVRWYRDYAGR
ncbi:MAG: NAD-dependent epimerase/dehydratase family protein [Hyphomicrobiales bacterium]|jgi:UDP-glucuronate 4-epimerase|nr:NAD-dependent epimerase/dehydratase family protein [Hyphomicrobiales bacterium]